MAFFCRGAVPLLLFQCLCSMAIHLLAPLDRALGQALHLWPILEGLGDLITAVQEDTHGLGRSFV